MYLSKSRYCAAVQCPKILWLKTNKPEEFDDSVMNEAVLKTGSEVGDLAMGLFGDFVEVPFSRNLQEMIDETDRLMQEAVPIIAEASFSYNGAFCSVDILKNLGDNNVELYEVKSATSVHEIYYHDVAYQCYVLSKLGYTVTRACVVHINNEYERHGELDIQQLFTIVDVTSEADDLYSDVEDRLAMIENYMKQTDDPDQEIGLQCFDPYECGFFGYCTRELPKPNIFDIASLRKKKKIECLCRGIVSFEDILDHKPIDSKYLKQVEFEIKDLPAEIHKDGIKRFLDTLSYPLYFLDFETFMPAVPLYDNSHPYEQITFQYSLHYIEEEGGELKHKEYLAYPGEDPRRGLAEQLCRDIPMNVCTIAYNRGFERGRIKGMARVYPDLADHLMNIHDNIVDLMVPFQSKDYYCKAMQGSYSIKYVLPALFPDDPALDYHNLEGVQNGGEAMDTFARMAQMEPDEIEEWREHLLRYCELDTFAMVKVWEKLIEVCG